MLALEKSFFAILRVICFAMAGKAFCTSDTLGTFKTIFEFKADFYRYIFIKNSLRLLSSTRQADTLYDII